MELKIFLFHHFVYVAAMASLCFFVYYCYIIIEFMTYYQYSMNLATKKVVNAKNLSTNNGNQRYDCEKIWNKYQRPWNTLIKMYFIQPYNLKLNLCTNTRLNFVRIGCNMEWWLFRCSLLQNTSIHSGKSQFYVFNSFSSTKVTCFPEHSS